MILAKTWPLLMKALSTPEAKTIVDAQMRDVLIKLGQLLGKDTSALNSLGGHQRISQIDQFELQ